MKNRPPRPGAPFGSGFLTGTSFVVQAANASPPVAASLPAASSLTTESLHNLLQQALQRILPTTLNVAFSITSGSGNSHWLLDFAFSNHMTHNLRSAFTHTQPVTDMSLQVANGAHLPTSGIGHIQSNSIELVDTLYVPQLFPNLASVGQLAEQGCHIVA
ncbi:unnamed protein product [Linum trigynum]|uniref:Retrovirus-related Pol polyprotein from transposon TNT 1-94-like beta-barrel domain-containing protein n=1 Tax=Linum trigynum TaxID=586398 RepID=A0AAV2FQD8_9ROSI